MISTTSSDNLIRVSFTHDTSGPIDYLSMVRELVSTEERIVWASSPQNAFQRWNIWYWSTAHHDKALNWEQLDAGQWSRTTNSPSVLLRCAGRYAVHHVRQALPGLGQRNHLLRNQVDRRKYSKPPRTMLSSSCRCSIFLATSMAHCHRS